MFHFLENWNLGLSKCKKYPDLPWIRQWAQNFFLTRDSLLLLRSSKRESDKLANLQFGDKNKLGRFFERTKRLPYRSSIQISLANEKISQTAVSPNRHPTLQKLKIWVYISAFAGNGNMYNEVVLVWAALGQKQVFHKLEN